MRRIAVLVLSLSLAGGAHARPSAEPGREAPVPVMPGAGTMLTSSGTAAALGARGVAGPDTFVLYGGPESATEGKFQLADRITPDWGGGNGLPGGYGGGGGAWTPVDRTEQTSYWHPDTFNAENLGGNGPGNHAMWCGLPATHPDAQGFVAGTGYGNGWFERLVYESAPVADPSVGQVVQLDFFFNYEITDVSWDFFDVEYDSAGTWTRVLSMTGTNQATSGEFPAPGIRFSDVQTQPIVYTGYDYGGNDGDRIRIRFVGRSDGAWSDADGLGPTDAGLAQVDDITLTTNQGTFVEDFEGAGPYLFEPYRDPFAGDYADVHPLMTDPDPCRSNPSPVLAFVDYGQTVRNGPGTTGLTTTGGSNSNGIDYGFPGSYVVNYTGGLSEGVESLTNEVYSPDIAWDLPGPDDDDPAIAGAVLEFEVWRDLPLGNGIFFLWHVRSAPAGGDYGPWVDRNFVYYGAFSTTAYQWGGGPTGGWLTHAQDVSDLLVANPERVQVALACWDYASVFGFPGTAATPSPVFDNVRVKKYRVRGPTLATRVIDTANDGFPVTGSIDVSTPAARDALDIPFDMARDVNSGDFLNEPGDSVIVDVGSVVAGATVADVRMVWALRTNALFEDAIRAAPARPKDLNVVAGAAGTVWTGEVVAEASTTSAGAVVDGRYFVDLPDADFLYPGDVLHYYIQATDTDGRTSTLPMDTSGFGDFGPQTLYDRAFTVRCLPSLRDAGGDQPRILVYNDGGRRGGESEWVSAFAQLGYHEGVDYDSYTIQGPTSQVSNGIGSAGAHGATSAQLAGYEAVFEFTGDLRDVILSDGDQGWADKGDDVGTLRGWLDTPGVRNIAHFGDGIATGNTEYPRPTLYVTEIMGVDYLDADVSKVIGGQRSPVVVPNAAGTHSDRFSTSFVAYGGCTPLRVFDRIQPLPGAEAGHYFADAAGDPIVDPSAGVASVIHPIAHGVSITFPYAPRSVFAVMGGRSAGLPPLAQLFGEVLDLFQMAAGSTAVSAPPARRPELSVRPNPFNPSTVVEFTAAAGARGTVRVYNLRGELVRTLHRGEFSTRQFTWDGTDDGGSAVASGVYVVQAEADGVRETAKVALVK